MKLNKEQLAAKREFITRGMKMVCDAGGPVTVVKSAPASDLSEIRKRIDALAVKIARR